MSSISNSASRSIFSQHASHLGNLQDAYIPKLFQAAFRLKPAALLLKAEPPAENVTMVLMLLR